MRGVLHNHPAHKVRRILENTKLAMAFDSILILDEMILPEIGAHVTAAGMDLTMLGAFAGMERTEAQWRDILEDSGLKLIRSIEYNPLSYEGIMEIRLP